MSFFLLMQAMKVHYMKLFLRGLNLSFPERKLLKKLVKKLVWYKPESRKVFVDGGVAIIDQWICAHASYFVGSYESTFSFRIREDRQLLGMTREDTFNDMCGAKDNENDPHSCEKPSYWHREGPSS